MTATPRKRISFWRYLIGIPLLLACALATAFAFLPAAEDPIIPLNEQGGGARQTAASINGLQAPFPDIPAVDPNQAALGRLLFYDPVLSANDDMSCATCHHPDLGFSDGRTVAQGSHGENLRRNAPSLWNVAYATSLFWDGRAKSLEDQMLVPLTSENEMGADRRPDGGAVAAQSPNISRCLSRRSRRDHGCQRRQRNCRLRADADQQQLAV